VTALDATLQVDAVAAVARQLEHATLLQDSLTSAQSALTAETQRAQVQLQSYCMSLRYHNEKDFLHRSSRSTDSMLLYLSMHWLSMTLQ
jgi:deoxyribodipyrimidine photolyase